MMMRNKILEGSALLVLKTLPSESIDCIITSPPYWALRDYKVDGQIGNEKTIDEYINNLLDIFNECKRILKKEGTCWVVISDTYSGNGGLSQPHRNSYGGFHNADGKRTQPSALAGGGFVRPSVNEVQDKSLCLIPERFALKMIENKWILRNKIIWYKSNCMPSSAKDRFTVDYENIYFFTKSQRYYFKTQYELYLKPDRHTGDKIGGTKYKDFQKLYKRPYGGTYKMNDEGRIKRCVWDGEDIPPINKIWKINTKPFPEAHFAVFPEELVEQCLDAGCPSNGLTLDPFMGSGTTALVALKNAMNFVGIELNPDYITMAMKRIEPYLKQEKLTQFTR